jgi:osmotically-inducible protein OsmY
MPDTGPFNSREAEIMVISLRSLVGAAMLLGSVMLVVPQIASAQTAADNTKVNKRDRAAQAVTADQQKETPADRDITKKIRQALTADKSLSMYAHNVKVITRDGTVTLKGPVRSEEEKEAVASKAATVVKAEQITNQLTIAPPKK